MKPNTRLLFSLIGLAIIDTVIPVPITALILLYAWSQKPPWFKELVARVYR
jgi:hypothetical protein